MTTTPRPIQIIGTAKQDRAKDPRTVVTKGTTYENRSNVSAGLPHHDAEPSTKARGWGGRNCWPKCWTIYRARCGPAPNVGRAAPEGAQDKLPDLARVVVGVDPSGTKGDSDGGKTKSALSWPGKGVDGHGYVLADYTCDLSPEGWGRR
jgi:hypothetical protein